MKTLNLITGDNWLFTDSTGDWQSYNCSLGSGSATVSLAIDQQFQFADRFNSLVVTPDSNDVASILLENVPIPLKYVGQYLDFHVRAYSTAQIRVRVTLTTNQGDEEIRFNDAASNRWTVARGDGLLVPDIGSVVLANVRICMFDHNQAPIRIAVPFLYGRDDAFASKFTAGVFLAMPRVMIDTDFDPEAVPNNLFYRILESGLYYAEYALDKMYDYEYVDEVTASLLAYSPTDSQLVDPSLVDFDTAAWLAQFLGFELDNPELNATPWGALSETNNVTNWSEFESNIDPSNIYAITALSRTSNVVTATVASHSLNTGDEIFVRDCTAGFNGTFTVTGTTLTSVSWAQTGTDETATTFGAIYTSDTEWGELEDFDPDFYDQQTYITWQLQNGYQGYNAGSLRALRSAAQFNLSETKTVTIEKNYLSDPWQIRVITKTSETPGGVDGLPAVVIQEDISKVRPVGYKITHICTATGS